MKYLVLMMMLLLASCYEDDIKKASDKCQNIVDEATEEVWNECMNFCETTLQEELSKLVDEFFKKLGCTPIGNPPDSWDCSALCR